MIAVIVIIAGLYVGCVALGSALRRAIPLAFGATIAWLIHLQTDAWAMAALVGLVSAGFIAALLDEAAHTAAMRPLVVTLECTAAVAVTTTFAFAVLNSAGVRGVELAALLVICAFMGAGLIARFRAI